MRSAISGGGASRRDLSARHVELGGGEQRAELVVQLAREAAALVLAHRLQVLRQLGQLRACVAVDLVSSRSRSRCSSARCSSRAACESSVAVWRRYMKSASRLSAAIAATPMRFSISVW